MEDVAWLVCMNKGGREDKREREDDRGRWTGEKSLNNLVITKLSYSSYPIPCLKVASQDLIIPEGLHTSTIALKTPVSM